MVGGTDRPGCSLKKKASKISYGDSWPTDTRAWLYCWSSDSLSKDSATARVLKGFVFSAGFREEFALDSSSLDYGTLSNTVDFLVHVYSKVTVVYFGGSTVMAGNL